ncbi:toprim domain-containing protein [Alistipes dispar]|uniref:toprim domain-containing protein n=1 Tax=Alistipes dispar TaxID=2585119 RepID=UPI003A841835
MDAKTINRFPIRDYLAGLGIRPAKDRGYYGMYRSPMREDRTPSMKVDYARNLWIDYGAGDGGTLIDLVMRLERCDAGEAMRRMEQRISGTPSFSFHGNGNSVPPHRESAIMVEKVQLLENPALVAYLTKRGIRIEIAREHCREVRYSINDREYFAIGFRNDAGGWELRSRYFKGSTSKAPTTQNGGHTDCLVFEGFMDYLSFMTLKGQPHTVQDIVVLNSVTNLGRAKPFIASHEQVYTYLDNDDAGRRATAELKAACRNLSDQSGHYRQHKDLNEYLQERQQAQRKKQSHGHKVQ